jgi:putative Mn2+ efflux pump MntP
MDVVTILFVAFGLAMDAFAVSIANGLSAEELRVNNALKMAIAFGAFQAFMPVLGWLAGLGLRDLISNVDHWMVFGFLVLVGLKMIYESVRLGSSRNGATTLSLSVLLTLSVATSIDALAVGLSFAFLQVSIAASVLVIGVVTFSLSFLGAFFGKKLGRFFESRIGIAGGLILIGIGLKILAEHIL